MKEKIKQKGFIQIPLLIGIIIMTVMASGMGAGVVLHKQGKLDSFLVNVSQVFKRTEEPTTIKPEEIKSKELLGQSQIEQDLEESQVEQELEKVKLEVEKARLEAGKAKVETERLKKEAEETRIKAEQELQRQLEIQRLAEEQHKQKELQRQEEAQKLAGEQAKKEAEEKERQLQQEYSYYIQRLNAIKNIQLSDKGKVSLAISQLDNSFVQDKNKAVLEYQNLLAQAERNYNLRLQQTQEYYAARGMAFSSIRSSAEGDLKEDYERQIQTIKNVYNKYFLDLENSYDQKEAQLRKLLNTIDSQIQDIDYLISKLQQKILSEADKLLLNKALNY